MEITERGMRIVFGDEAERMQEIIWTCTDFAERDGFRQIMLPTIEPRWIYEDKLSDDFLDNQTFHIGDDYDMPLLRPEGTATIQAWARQQWKSLKKDTKVYYVARCFRRERPQRGRYREFTQFGVEILKPSEDHSGYLIGLAGRMVGRFAESEIFPSVSRGLGYYTGGNGFEIECASLGAQKQVVGGGAYDEGIGFALGVDRLALVSGTGT